MADCTKNSHCCKLLFHCWLQVQFDPDQTGPRGLLEAVQDAGFDGHIIDTDRYSQLSALGVLPSSYSN